MYWIGLSLLSLSHGSIFIDKHSKRERSLMSSSLEMNVFKIEFKVSKIELKVSEFK